jgi:hypothetical protein
VVGDPSQLLDSVTFTLYNNQIGEAGAKSLADALKSNTTLTGLS